MASNIRINNRVVSTLQVGDVIAQSAYYGSSLVAVPVDFDAVNYIAAVEAADGQRLEEGVKQNIKDFVTGCKFDGIWDAIKASCILAGARTLNGALVPLAGDAPTNFNFVSADYDRVTGLKGDGSTKYLDSNRANDADPQDNQHLAVWLTQLGGTDKPILGDDNSADGASLLYHRGNGSYLFKSRSSALGAGGTISTGFMGLSRNNSVDFDAALGATDVTYTVASQVPSALNLTLFRSLQNGVSPSYYSGRASFYSVGENVNLPALRTRVAALMTALDGAIA